jgi:hypothetical protein
VRVRDYEGGIEIGSNRIVAGDIELEMIEAV